MHEHDRLHLCLWLWRKLWLVSWNKFPVGTHHSVLSYPLCEVLSAESFENETWLVWRSGVDYENEKTFALLIYFPINKSQSVYARLNCESRSVSGQLACSVYVLQHYRYWNEHIIYIYIYILKCARGDYQET